MTVSFRILPERPGRKMSVNTNVAAAAEAIRAIERSTEVEAVQDRFRPKQTIGEVVFCCVDSISVRGAMWRSVSPRYEFWSDGRMLAEVIRVLTVSDISLNLLASEWTVC